MFENLLKGLVSNEDKEKAAKEAIQKALKDIAKELSCDRSGFVIMIRPTDDNFNPACYVLKSSPDLLSAIPPTIVREITIKEIMSEKEEE